MIRTLAVLLLLLPTLAFAQTSDQAIRDAIALMDSGNVDESIAALTTVLATEPANTTAKWELALAYSLKRDFAHCRDTIAPLADTPGPLQVRAISLLGSCVDQTGERDKAIEVYRRGLAVAPESAELLYNLAITLMGKKSYDEARTLFERDTRVNPWHASSHYALARLFELQNFRVPAAFAFLHYLALEPATSRAADAAPRLMSLVTGGIKKTKEGVNITIDSNPRKEEGDYSSMEMMMAIVSTSVVTDLKEEDGKKQSEFEKARGSLGSLIAIFLESTETEHTDYTAAVQRPFFESMQKEKLVDVFTGIALGPLKLKGADAWAKANEKEIARYTAWAKPQTQNKPIALPQ